ncbi:Sodium/solute symporter [Corchorus olitorius]|uniref:Sodium/solute symporter n=1 Tax=Corchorus olitorius TaxID=93759 RepID=A0A1R3G2U9_9ROSI|nr:Sodium/solute symporter [Corchorus olitorius]
MSSGSGGCPPFDFSAKYYHVSEGLGCVRQSSFFEGKAVLNQGLGYALILGFGAFFAIVTSLLVWLEKRYVGSNHTSEWFNTAGRNVKTGLIASVIVSQVLLFGVMAIEIKRKAPYAHTVCEIVKARWGNGAHVVFLAFCLVTNIIVTAMLLLGGSAVVNALTGVNIYAASFLIPLGGYWVSAIAARPSSTHKGYLLGGLVWFAVPFALATSLGLGAVALDLPLTEDEASHGLVPPATAMALMGKGGSLLLLMMLFMAVTSAGSSELIAVSSLCTYDIYRTYINPHASGKKILRVSRAVVLGFGCFMGLFALVLNKAGVSLGWMYLAMGVLIGSAVLPIAFMLLWKKANAVGAITGSIVGCVFGIITWLSVARVEYGHINLDTTGKNAPMLAGNLVSILTGGAIHAVCSLLSPQNYNWDTTRQITMVEKEKSDLPAEEFKEEKLRKAKSWILKWGVGFTLVIVVLWPLLTLPAGSWKKLRR